MDPHNKVIKEKSLSPSVNVVDSSPLQPAMEKNRESLKIKLMVRRSANQLVEQGILPPLKTSPAIHEKSKNLERAKTGDLLKAKIQQRPNREELERRHILESHESHIDPSLADKYRMLEKAILVDQLNSKISHRPGPLELIEKNILHTNEPIERIVKEGLVPFKLSTSDNTLFEDDSQSSEGDVTQSEGILIKAEAIPVAAATTTTSNTTQHQIHVNTNFSIDKNSTQPVNLNLISLNLPIQTTTSIIGQNSLIPSLSLKVPTTSIEHDAITLPCIVAENIIAAPPPPPPVPEQQVTCSLEKKPSFDNLKKEFKTPTATIEGSNIKQHISSFIQNNQKYSSIGKEKSRKKCKIKPASKIKAIKFHEYKGPPNAQSKTTLTSSSNNISKKCGETNYELIMQQQCLLEYLEGIYKSNNNSGSISSISNNNNNNNGSVTVAEAETSQKKHCLEEKSDKIQEEPRIVETSKKPFITIFPSKSTANASVLPEIDLLSNDYHKLSKMKVSELKAYLKKLNLPVSGPKPLLIERLKNFLPSSKASSTSIASVVMSPEMCENSSDITDMQLSSNLADSDLDIRSNFSGDDNDIVKEQQRQIEELQRKLLESQSELEKIKLNQSNDPIITTATIAAPTTSSSSVAAVTTPLSEPCLSKNEKIFQIIPSPANVLYDTKYQIPGKLSTVFVVGVAGLNATQDCPSVPMLIHEEVSEQEVTVSKTVDPLAISAENKFFVNTTTAAGDVDKNHTYHHDTPIVQDDINDVLEILLKNEKWNTEADNSAINYSDNMIPESTKPQAESSSSTSAICYANEPPLKFTDDDSGSLSVVDVLKSPKFETSGALISDSIGGDNLRDFPMEIEENSSTCMQSESNSNNNEQMSCFRKNKEIEENSQFNVFDGFGVDALKTNVSDNNKTTNGYNGIKNSLIGNFDNGLFDTFKSNIMNSNIINSTFLNNNNFNDQKDLKSNEKLGYNSFDLFGNTAIDTITENAAPMEIENILSYDLYQHDTFFNVNHNNNDYQGNSQNNSFTTNHHHHHHQEPSSEMFCDDDNLFDSEKVLKW